MGGVCSQVAGVEALRVRLKLVLFPLTVCFPISLHLELCPNGEKCWSKWGSCAYKGPMLCLCICLWLCSPCSHIFPCCGCPRSSARLWYRVSGGQGIHLDWAEYCSKVVMGILAATLPSEVWATSRALLVQGPIMVTLFGLCPGSLGCLCIPRSSIFPGPTCPTSSAKLWGGVSGTRAFIWLGLGNKLKQ